MKIVSSLAALLVLSSLSAEKLIKSYNFDRHNHGWYTASYFSGKVKHSTDGYQSKGAIELTSTPKKGKIWGQMVSYDIGKFNFTGKKLQLEFYAKGSGKLIPNVFISYITPRGQMLYRQVPGCAPIALTNTYQKYTAKFDLSELSPLTLSICIKLDGPGKVVMDEVKLSDLVKAELKIVPQSPHQVIALGSKVAPVEFKSTVKSAPARIFVTSRTQPLKKFTVQSDAAGKIVYQGEAGGLGLNYITAMQQGATARTYISVLKSAEYAQFDQLAKQFKAAKPLNILFLGDSICDFDRGKNGVDKLEFFLNKYQPGKVKIHNFAIAGDYISRVEQRLLGRQCWKRYGYRDLWKNKYDLIILQLGNNDTRATTNDKFASPLVPTAQVAPAYARVLKLIRQHSQAPIILTSANCCDAARMAKNGQRALGRWFFARFGMDEYVLPFNAAVQKVAKEHNCEYLDLYTPMKAQFNAKNYVEGVHLTEPGHVLYAKIFLEYLVKRQ